MNNVIELLSAVGNSFPQEACATNQKDGIQEKEKNVLMNYKLWLNRNCTDTNEYSMFCSNPFFFFFLVNHQKRSFLSNMHLFYCLYNCIISLCFSKVHQLNIELIIVISNSSLSLLTVGCLQFPGNNLNMCLYSFIVTWMRLIQSESYISILYGFKVSCWSWWFGSQKISIKQIHWQNESQPIRFLAQPSISWKQIIDHYYTRFLIVKRFSGLKDRLRCLCVYVNSMRLGYMENWAQSFVKFSYLGSHQKILVKLDSID